jgi:hypothetical protein
LPQLVVVFKLVGKPKKKFLPAANTDIIILF